MTDGDLCRILENDSGLRLRICLFLKPTILDVVIHNQGTADVYVDSNDSAYVDEDGTSWPLSTSGSTIKVSASEQELVNFVPKRKRYLIREGGLRNVQYTEPIIPIDFGTLTRPQTEAYLDDFSRASRTVSLQLRLKDDTCTYTQRIRLGLDPLFGESVWKDLQRAGS